MIWYVSHDTSHVPEFLNRRFGRRCHVMCAEMPSVSTIVRDTMEVKKIADRLACHVRTYFVNVAQNGLVASHHITDTMALERGLNMGGIQTMGPPLSFLRYRRGSPWMSV